MMLKWKDSYSCNISEIDKQHKKLFEIAEKIYELASLKDDYDHFDEIMVIFQELKDYTIYHFGYEESLLQKHGYADLETHKIEHDFFIKKLKRLERSDIEGEQNKALLDMIHFVTDWITGHILKKDMGYKDHLISQGVE